jgi:hypothetical protein
MTEVWFRNPSHYIRELVECGAYKIAWDRGFIVKKRIDPLKHADLYFGEAYPWRVMLIGPQGAAEYQSGDTFEKPTAVYPVWRYGEDIEVLQEIVENPVGEDQEACENKNLGGDERPVIWQPHRVVITELPSVQLTTTRAFLRELKVLQEDFPDCRIHLHGLYSYRVSFGMGFGSSDVECRTSAAKGKITLPTGRVIRYEESLKYSQWLKIFDTRYADLSQPRNRCIYNIKSALWAGKNFTSINPIKVGTTPVAKLDLISPNSKVEPIKGRALLPGAVPQAGDKIQCNLCSLQTKCNHFRVGAVCSLPDAEPARLAALFKTRDADTIIDGLGTLMAAGANRLELASAWEQIEGSLDPEVTKMMHQLFGQGVTLAKLLDPNLRGGVKVNVGVHNGNAAVQINGGNPKVLIAGVIRELEQQGIDRKDITQEMIEGVLAGMANKVSQQQAIEGTVIDHKES